MTTESTPSTHSTQKPIVMSGMRTTGFLHLGHYLGVLTNWVHLQNQGLDCYFMTADWHGLTTKQTDGEGLAHWRRECVLDWLAAGVDPTKATIYAQSHIPEIAELHLLLSMITPNKWCETDPTLKDMVALLRNRSDAEAGQSSEAMGELTYGLLGYPVLQTADILSMGASLVPVGKDQVAHLELSRDVARRFNHLAGQTVFAEPRPLLTEMPTVLGLDGRKMSKSYDNGIFLSDDEATTLAKVKKGVTDTNRIKKTDAGTPSLCSGIFPMYQTLATPEVLATVTQECETATRGCMACKTQLAELINETLRPMRERRQALQADPDTVEAILKAGAEKAREPASKKLRIVRKVFHL
ncbi:MAG: tryptophan--tRNA ligase [Vampirovibrionales bacterium]